MMTPEYWNTLSHLGNILGLVLFSVQLTLWLSRDKKDKQLQYVIKSIKDVAFAKTLSWQNQLSLSMQKGVTTTLQEIKLIKKTLDEFSEISSLANSLELTINTTTSTTSESIENLHKQEPVLHSVNKSIAAQSNFQS